MGSLGSMNGAGTMEDAQLMSAAEPSRSEKPLRRKKSLTRLFSSASRRSCPTPPSLKEAYLPPTPQVPPQLRQSTPKLSPQPATTSFDLLLKDHKSRGERGVGETLVGLGLLAADAERQPLRPKKRKSIRHLSLRQTNQKSLTGDENAQRPRTASMDHSTSKYSRDLHGSSPSIPLRKSKSTRTGLRMTSGYNSFIQRLSTSAAVPTSQSSPVIARPSRPSTSAGTSMSPRSAGSRPHRGRSFGGSPTTTSPDPSGFPPSPQRPWQAMYSDAEVRSSLRSALTTGSSRTYATDTTRSSVVTKDTSITDVTVDPISRRESKIGDGILTVDEAIDMYAAGFTDDVEEELGDSRDTSLSDEERRRSVRIAEAFSDNMGSPISPRPSTSRSSRSHTFNSRRPSEITSLPTSSLPLIANRDQYGFVKSSHYITRAQYDSWSAEYLPIQERRNNKWTSYMRDSGLPTDHPMRFPSRSAKTQRYIRKGIPSAWRGPAWFHYAGGDAYLSRHPQLYNNLVHLSNSKLHAHEKESIERDLHRTFPDNIRFKPDPDRTVTTSKETGLLSSLRRVLRAFALHSPKIGYCQSLNFIAGLLLLFLPEEKAFWMLHIITSIYLPGTHETSLEGANVDLWVLMVALKNSLPGVWAKVGAAGAGNEIDGKARLPPISLCTTSWFMSLFIGTLPVETVLRVWDVLFYEGSRTLFRVASAIFKLGEPAIRAVTDSMELFQVVQGLPRGMIDAGKFMDTVNRKGGVGSDWVERRRGERRIWFAKEREKKVLGLEHRLAAEGKEEESDVRKDTVARKSSVWRRKKMAEVVG